MSTTKFLMVRGSRLLATSLIVGLFVFPVAYAVFYAIENFLQSFPTLHLLALALGLWFVGLLVVTTTPRVRAAVRDQLFPGSYDYNESVQKLAAEIGEGAGSSDVIAYSCSQLSRLTRSRRVRLIEQDLDTKLTPRILAVHVPGSTVSSGALLLEEKTNGEPWVGADKRLLEWYVGAISVTLNLARERDLEQRRLVQVKQQVGARTAELADLHRYLSNRDTELANRLDELAHDFKNPLTHMANALERATWTAENSEDNLGKDFSLVRAEVMWMVKFVDHMLDLARAEAGKVQLRRKPVLLADLLDDVRYELSEYCRVQNRTISWSNQAKNFRNVSISADAGLLYKVFRLLLIRAVRMTAKQVHLALTLNSTERNVMVDLITTPTHRADDEHQNLLSRWDRDGQHGDDHHDGITGLELAIAGWVLKAHHGQLYIAEANERQTVLRATLPIQPSLTTAILHPSLKKNSADYAAL